MANKKSGLLSKVPLPDTFFSIKHQLRPIAPLRLSAPSAVVVYLLTLGGFIGCWIFYSLPNPPVTETVIQSEWQKEGYVCKPLQVEPNYKTFWNYTECTQKLKAPSTDSVTRTKAAPKGEWKYFPFGSDFSALIIPEDSKDVHKDIDTCMENECKTIFNTQNDMVCTAESDSRVLRMGWLNDKGWSGTTNDFVKAIKKCVTISICDTFKANTPFQCTKTEVTFKSPLEILSLSIANTQLLFGVLTAFCAYIFYKMKGNKEISPAGEAGWQEAVRQLREELSRKADKSDQQTV